MTQAAIKTPNEAMDEADTFYYSAWVRGSHLELPLKKILFAIRNREGFMVCGDSGLGKSSLAAHVRDAITSQTMLSNKTAGENAVKPVLSIALENRSRTRDVMLDLLAELGIEEENIPTRDRTEKKLRKLLFEQIAICQVKVILVDEFQHLLRRGNSSVNMGVADFIKVLMTRTRISIGLFGMDEGATLLKLDRQIDTRWIQPYVLQPMTLDSNGEPLYFEWFLAELLKVYPRKTRNFASRENALRFLMLSGGNLRALKKLLTPLIRETKHCQDQVLTMEDVETVYKNINHDVVFRGSNGRKVDPFRSGIEIVQRYLRDARGL